MLLRTQAGSTASSSELILLQEIINTGLWKRSIPVDMIQVLFAERSLLQSLLIHMLQKCTIVFNVTVLSFLGRRFFLSGKVVSLSIFFLFIVILLIYFFLRFILIIAFLTRKIVEGLESGHDLFHISLVAAAVIVFIKSASWLLATKTSGVQSVWIF